MKVSRRNFLKSVGMGAAVAGVSGFGYGNPLAEPPSGPPDKKCEPQGSNKLFDHLKPCCPGESLAADEMRITFLGTSPIARLTQQGVSVYVEVGPTDEYGAPLDYAMFDCGMGVHSNYMAMLIPYRRMDKIFIAHLHADHMCDLSSIYCFGEAYDRKSPLYVWGPGPSGVEDPVSGKTETYDDGIKNTLEHFREVWRWHTESFSFSSNSYRTFSPPSQAGWHTPVELEPVGKYSKYKDPYYTDPLSGYTYYDAYALVPIELPWQNYGEVEGDNIAYWNEDTGLKITHFPVIHTRQGAIGYKLEWTPPAHPEKTLSMIYSSDTKPNNTILAQSQGVDVLIHEMVMPPDQWAAHSMGVSVCDLSPTEVEYMQTIQNSSHTSQAAFGYLMSRLQPLPRLTVATHFQAQDDTIASAIKSLDAFHIPRDKYTFAADFMMLNLTTDKSQPVRQRRVDVSRFSFGAMAQSPLSSSDLNAPKYQQNGRSNPDAQIDNTEWIPYTGHPDNPLITYDKDGYNYPHDECS
jgi:ribonuclease Z